MRWALYLSALVAAVAWTGSPRLAAAAEPSAIASERGRAKVDWTRIAVPPSDDSARTERVLRKLLDRAVKKADFGKARKLSASVRVLELQSELRDGVLRVSCTLVGKLQGGQSAKARISFGGDPSKAESLELEVLTMVANGLVTRIAELARARAALEQ